MSTEAQRDVAKSMKPCMAIETSDGTVIVGKDRSFTMIESDGSISRVDADAAEGDIMTAIKMMRERDARGRRRKRRSV